MRAPSSKHPTDLPINHKAKPHKTPSCQKNVIFQQPKGEPAVLLGCVTSIHVKETLRCRTYFDGNTVVLSVFSHLSEVKTRSKLFHVDISSTNTLHTFQHILRYYMLPSSCRLEEVRFLEAQCRRLDVGGPGAHRFCQLGVQRINASGKTRGQFMVVLTCFGLFFFVFGLFEWLCAMCHGAFRCFVLSFFGALSWFQGGNEASLAFWMYFLISQILAKLGQRFWGLLFC